MAVGKVILLEVRTNKTTQALYMYTKSKLLGNGNEKLKCKSRIFC
jgi:hypothetical protein